MRSAILVTAAAAGLVAALPQNIDFAAANAAPTPSVQGPAITALSQAPTYNPSVAASSAAAAAATSPVATTPSKRSPVEERRLAARQQSCAAEPDGYGPVPSPDTADAFETDQDLANIAANAPVPQGYQLVFQGLSGSTSQNGYMGLYTLTSYDTIQCQQYCDAAEGCTAFNMYLERDPSVNPGPGCDDPPSVTNYECTLWGLPICDDTATNTGQWRDNFQVVITGSNGYVKNVPPPSYTNFTGPTELGGAIQAPLANGVNTYIGMRMFPGPYDPSSCAAVCQETTTYDSQHPASDGTYMPCNFFNSYVLSENDIAIGTYCSFYTQAWDRSYATNDGQYDGEGNYYSVSSSYSYTLTKQDPGTTS